MGSLVVQMLAQHEQTVVHYLAGLDLLRSSALQSYPTVILDLSLPDIDGFEMINKLADHAPHVDLLLISGRGHATLDSARLVAEGLGFNVVATLNKPFSSMELCIALKLEGAFSPSQGVPLA